MKKHLFILIGATSSLSQAITIVVNDPSFELNPAITADGEISTNLAPDWQERDGDDSFTTFA